MSNKANKKTVAINENVEIDEKYHKMLTKYSKEMREWLIDKYREKEDLLAAYIGKLKLDSFLEKYPYLIDEKDMVENLFEENKNRTAMSDLYYGSIMKLPMEMREWCIDGYSEEGRHFGYILKQTLETCPTYPLTCNEEGFEELTVRCLMKMQEVCPDMMIDYPLMREYVNISWENANLMHTDIDDVIEGRLEVMKKIKKEFGIGLPEDVVEWFVETWNEYKINLLAFAVRWTAYFKRNNLDEYERYTYEDEVDLFSVGELFEKIKDKPFMENRKSDLEVLLMYVWIAYIDNDGVKYWDEYIDKTDKLLDKAV